MVDINLNGTLYFARLAVAYLKENHKFDSSSTTAESITSSKCITLVSSVAGFKESPGLFAYSAAKHGVMGLMRSLRGYVAPLYGLRVNAICTYLSCLYPHLLPFPKGLLTSRTVDNNEQVPGRQTRNSSTGSKTRGSRTPCP